MIITNTIRTIALASIVAAGSLALFAQTASAAPSTPSVSEIVVTKATDDGGDVDGRDFLIWQRNPSVAEIADRADLASGDSSESASSDYNTWRTNFGRTGY